MLGYLTWDIAVLLYHRKTISLLWETLAHHTVAFLAVLTGIMVGGPHVYIAWAAAQEVSTPFVNILWWLRKTPGGKSTQLYFLNGLALAITFGLFRVLPQPWILWCSFTDMTYINDRYSNKWYSAPQFLSLFIQLPLHRPRSGEAYKMSVFSKG